LAKRREVEARTYDYPSDDELVESVARLGTFQAVSVELGMPPTTLRWYISQRGLGPRMTEARREHAKRRAAGRVSDVSDAEDPLEADVRKALKKPTSVEALADAFEVPPKRIKETLEKLRTEGYRIPEDEARIRLEQVAPDKARLHPALFQGKQHRVAVVADTHLCSQEEALPELDLAYDMFADQGIREVWHAGDIVDGLGIYRGQNAEVTKHTLDMQIEYASEHYPMRDGITTRLIGGNHDLQGEAGRVGLDLAAAIANRRDDIEYLGPWSAYIDLHGGATVHLLHGGGGMSYSYSYKAQRLTEGYSLGRKPRILVPGHWHVRADMQSRGVQVLFPGCFQWRSPFMERLGLTPAVGFHIVDMTIGDDGSLVQWAPRWYPYWEGRHVK
jgi:predicted phosphodiesterase